MYLFVCIDDHSRLITGHRFGHAEDSSAVPRRCGLP
jgi:hypothetical protein